MDILMEVADIARTLLCQKRFIVESKNKNKNKDTLLIIIIILN